MSQSEKDPWAEDLIDKPPEGIGGWLLLPLLTLVAVPILTVLKLVSLAKTAAAGAHLMAGHPIFVVLAIVVLIVMLVQLFFGIFCLVQLFRKKRSLPRLVRIWFALGVASTALVALQYALDPILFSTAVDPNVTTGGEKLAVALNSFWFGLWMVYFDVSERVKNTFVR